MSSVRVSIQQSTLIMASFMSDQLEQDLKRNRLVDEGKLSQAEADERADEWEKVRLSVVAIYLLLGGLFFLFFPNK